MIQFSADVFLVTVLLGSCLGFIGGLLGFGGGIVAIPVLVVAYGMDQTLAQGTALVMMVPNLLLGWYRYNQRQKTPAGLGFQIGLGACLTTWLMASVAVRLDAQLMRAIFSVFLTGLALQMLLKRFTFVSQVKQTPAKENFLPVVGMLGGASMGLLGVGGGLLATPLFTGWFGLRQTVAQSYSLAVVAPSSVIALMAYSSEDKVSWQTGLPLALGGVITVSFGVALAHRLPERSVQITFAWMLLATAIWIVAKPFILG